MNKQELIDEIKNSVNDSFDGKFDAEEQQCDMHIVEDGLQNSIRAIDSETVYFDDEERKIDELSVQDLLYIKTVLN